MIVSVSCDPSDCKPPLPPRWRRRVQAARDRVFGSPRAPPAARTPTVRRIRAITLLAALADVTIAAIIPLVWFLTSQASLHGELEMRAQLYATAVVEEARRDPALRSALVDGSPGWAAEGLDIARAPDADDPDVRAERRRVFSSRQHVLIDTVTANRPLSPLLVVRLPVTDRAIRLGTVELSGSLRPTVVLTVAVACGSAGLGLLMFMLLRIEPLRMLADANARASFLTTYDLLTGLPNRRMFNERLEQAAAEALRSGSRVAVFYVDLDHLTTINDMMGNQAGDTVLRTVAERLRGCLRAGDTLARLGGDEFGIIQTQLHRSEDAEGLGHRLLSAMGRPVTIDGPPQQVGISIGAAVSDLVAPSQPEQLMQRADMALHQAKQEGRGRLCFFAPDMNVKLRERHAMGSDLRTAIADDALILHYQPQIELLSGRVCGAEALLRWNRPGHGMVPPDHFIPLAEDSGLIVPIGTWVLREACRRASTWPAHIGIAVNVSIVQLRQPGFCQVVIEALRDSGIAPSRLELELTESVLMQDTADTLATMQRLRALGPRLAMDDFGTGYSSLGYLQKFRFDKIKIDRSFVSRMGQDSDANAIVRAVVVMTEALGIRANAEGVETAAQADALRGAGCSEAQGFFYSRPLPGEAFDALVRGNAVEAPAAVAI